MTADSWGDPSKNTFRKTNIREAKQGETRANVHALIRPLVEELWGEWDQQGIDLSSVHSTPDDPLGLTFSIDPALELPVAALGIADALGFAKGDDCLHFVASPTWARTLSEKIAARDMSELSQVFIPEPVEGHRPGSRELKRGDEGTDVKMVQLFLGANATGKYDAATQKLVMQFQELNHIPDTGNADKDFWAYLIPRVIRWKRMGEAGREIRIVQAALITFGYQAGPVSGRYGMVMNRALYVLRGEKGIVGSTKIDRFVWETLFDLQWQYVAPSLAVQGA
jgi:peptidoglycan hydrolase-like protein with peptidoglycan-binding domain